MPGTEQQPGFAERTGATVRNVGIVIGLVGLLGMWADWRLPNEGLALGGAGLAASGEIFRRVAKPK